nr:PREDICTED: corticosteroid 11-beta-dehydrogenase isozyme 2 [Latimeria chalumnae]|eukprot:XP_006011815.2 PREDICTED: corticosteroid 11-beta-dehydrogenase isozyme 2 [Latimeria chalumnae]
MDITKPEDIKNALSVAKAETGVKGLWGLVNNAGICVNFGDAELSLMSNYRGCMEINFFGTLEVTKAFLPLVRHSKGRIVTVSSPAGEHPFPSLAAYGASKAALNLFINSLRHELKHWGVKICTVLPGSYKTGRISNIDYWEQEYGCFMEALSPELMQDYGEEYLLETKKLFLEQAELANEDLSPVIASITDALLSVKPQTRYYAGKGLLLTYFILSYMPLPICDIFSQRLFVNNKVIPKGLRKQQNTHKAPE